MKGMTVFVVAFVLSRVFSAPTTQTYKTVRYHSIECNNDVVITSLNEEFYTCKYGFDRQ